MHWRVIDNASEAPGGASGQYGGDFWGITRVFENYDSRFLDAHDLRQLSEQRRSKLHFRYELSSSSDTGRSSSFGLKPLPYRSLPTLR